MIRTIQTLTLLLLLAGCGDGLTATGTLQFQVDAEDTIPGGLQPGADEGTVDDWTVTFDKYIVAIGHVELEGNGPVHLHGEDELVVDLVQLPEGGLTLTTFEGAEIGTWPEVFYETPSADADAERHASVSQEDFDRMVAGGCTYLITGTLSNPAGERCVGGDSTMCEPTTSVAFDLCVPAATTFGPCESDGLQGVVVGEGLTTSVNLTIHGDHLFFNGFPMGAEGTVARRAQWMVNADVDADGTVTQDDLESIGASDLGQLLPSDLGDGMPGFALTSPPIPLNDGWDYVVAQLKTQGHFQGEGECPWDGTSHDHE